MHLCGFLGHLFSNLVMNTIYFSSLKRKKNGEINTIIIIDSIVESGTISVGGSAMSAFKIHFKGKKVQI